MATNKRETVSVSFHYLTRAIPVKGKPPTFAPFSEVEFENLCAAIHAKPVVDIEKATFSDLIHYRLEAPMERPSRLNKRTLFGVYQAAYTGHSYKNSARGKIPADSISLRPFHYLIYLSDKGRIYVASQYLGQFGGYSALERTLRNMLNSPETILPHSFRVSGSYYKNAKPTEVRVSFSNSATSSIGKPTLGSNGMVAFRPIGKEDGFEAQVKNRILPYIGRPSSEIKSALAAILNESDLMAVSDADIEDCTVLATVNGRKNTTIYMLENGSFATKFPLDIEVNADGHPEYDLCRDQMLEILGDEIISRAEID